MTTISFNKLFDIQFFTESDQLVNVQLTIKDEEVSEEFGGQKGPDVLSGYVGGEVEKNLHDDFTQKLELNELVVKYWTNKDKSTLKTIAIFSKHRAPFGLFYRSIVIHEPSSIDNVNTKYIQMLLTKAVDGVNRLLLEEPRELPITPICKGTSVSDLFHITPYTESDQLVNVQLTILEKEVSQEVGGQKDPIVLSGYVGGQIEKNLPNDFTEKLDLKELVIKYWTNEDKSTLKTIALFSKHREPFLVYSHSIVSHVPPSNDNVNSKYFKMLKTEGVDGAHRLLKENPTEFPIILFSLVKDELGGKDLRTSPYSDGRINFRSAVEGIITVRQRSSLNK